MPEKYTPEIQELRGELYKELKEKRQKRDESRKKSKRFTERIIGSPKLHSDLADTYDEGARAALVRGKDKIDLAIAQWQTDFEASGNYKTDQSLVQWFYKRFRNRGEAHPVATDTFIDKSREEYNEAWLTRELAQNFIDHNPKDPGTLNGVKFEREQLEGDKDKVRFRISGDWSFEDPTGVISPHSEKPQGMRTAGGNGIGLKQTAIRLLRDFGVKKFEIAGEEWQANYQLAKKERVNAQLEQAFKKAGRQPNRRLRHDWLMVELQPTEEKGQCVYVIETSNRELIAALDQFEELGVSDRNKFLQHPDFKNKHGLIKWLIPKSGEPVPRPQESRLFINGQVMNYETKGQTARDYWRGPQYVTLSLNNVDYKMNVDRPPVTSYELRNYMDQLLRSMTVPELIQQIKVAEPLWTERPLKDTGADVVLENLVKRLYWSSEYKKEDFKKIFFEKKYLAFDRDLSQAQMDDLNKRGFVICPSYFKDIGMPAASSELTEVEQAQTKLPNSYGAEKDRTKASLENGIEVAYEDLSEINNDQFLAFVKARLPEASYELAASDPNKLTIKLSGEIPSRLLSNILIHPKDEQQKLLYFIRGLAYKGLTQTILNRISLHQGEYITTFAVSYDIAASQQVLLARNNEIKQASDGTITIELEVSDAYKEQLQALLREPQHSLVKASGGSRLDTASSLDTAKATATTAKENESSPGTGLVVKDREGESLANPVTLVEVDLTPEALAVAQKIEERIPDLAHALEQLQAVVPPETEQSKVDFRVKIYQDLKASGSLEQAAQRNSNYLGAKSLLEILREHNRDNVPGVAIARPVTRAEVHLTTISAELMNIANRFRPPNEMVYGDFEIVLSPSERQLAQLGLLRMYVGLTTEAEFNNELLVYRGSGTKAINIGTEAIGIHEELLNADFIQAAAAMVHELTHNKVSGHGQEFLNLEEALFAQVQKKLLEVIEKMSLNQELSQQEQLLQRIYTEWNNLR